MRKKLSIGVLAVTAVLAAALVGSAGLLFSPPSAQGAYAVVATAPSGGQGPFDVAVNPGAGLVYVTHENSADISILSANPNFGQQPGSPVVVGAGAAPHGVAYNANGDNVFVADHANNVVTRYQGVSPWTSSATGYAGNDPFGVAANPNNNLIYVANEASNDVVVLDGSAAGFPQVLSLPNVSPSCPAAPFPAGSQPRGVAVNTSNNLHIYVTLHGANQMWIMDGILASPLACPPPVTVGTQPLGVAYNPADDRIYVANHGSSDLTVIDAPSPYSVVVPSLPVGPSPWGVAVNPNPPHHIYVTNTGGNSVSVIDGDPASPNYHTVVATVTVGNGPRGVAVDPATNRVFVANYNDNTVSVIEDVAAPPPTPTQPAGAPTPTPPTGATQQAPLGTGCNNVSSSWPDATAATTIANGVAPQSALVSIWLYNVSTGWRGYSAQYPAQSTLQTIDYFNAFWICVTSAATLTQPVP